MSTSNIYFSLVDLESLALTGSKITIHPYYGPIITNGNILYNGPKPRFTDVSGSATFNNVPAGVYVCKITGPNANNPPIFVSHVEELFYIQVPDNAGPISASQHILDTLPPFTGSYSTYSLSSSYSVTASFALNGGGGSTYPTITDIAISSSVGINETNPIYTLDVNGTIGNSLGNNYLISSLGGNTYFGANSGLVGIANNNPIYTLDVSGDINLTGLLLYNGISGIPLKSPNGTIFTLTVDNSGILQVN